MSFFKFRTFTRPFLDEKGRQIEGSIAKQAYLYLNGCKQWVLFRGKDIHNPILIFLHGGPGFSEHEFFRYYNSDLENHFLVVGWDQRGTGKSYSRKINPKTMTLDQFISDLHELIVFLKNHFGHNKVYLLGKSWGSLLGILYAKKYPQDLIAYIGTGQVSNVKKSEQLSFDFTLSEAQKRNNKKALRELQGIHEPGINLQDVKIQRKWLVKFGGHIYKKTTLRHDFIAALSSVDEYALPDLMSLIYGSRMSLKFLWPLVIKTNLFQQVPQLEVPVFFLLGRYDYCVPASLASEYFEHLKAPFKKLIWFENSGHNPPFEEPIRFNQEILLIKNATF